MRTEKSRALVALTAAGLMLAACSGSNSTPTTTVSTGTVSGLLTTANGSGTSPVVGATITTIPDVTDMAAAPSPSDATGKYSIELPTGVYSLVFAGPGVTRKQVDGVTVLAGKTTTLDQSLAYSPIALTVSTPPNPAGFASKVSLSASATGATGTLSYTWTVSRAAPAAWGKGKAYTAYVRVVNGGKVYECTTAGTSATSGSGPSGTTTADDSISDGTAKWKYVAAAAALTITASGDGSHASFTTESLADVKAGYSVQGLDIPNRPGFVAMTVGAADTMAYTVKVNVTDGQYSQNASTTVYPATYSQGSQNVPMGAMIVATDGDIVSNAPFATYAWTMTFTETDTSTFPPTIKAPVDATASLHGASTQTPWFIADKRGDYALKSNAVADWVSGHQYAVGDYAIAHGNLYKCTTAGVSGSTAPSATSGTITDNTAKWSYQFTPRAIVLHADSFSGVTTCATCHDPVAGAGLSGVPQAQYTPYVSSGHANYEGSGKTLFHQELAGTQHGGATCLRCHVTGYDLGETGNNGFSDRAAAEGWTYPTTFSEANYTNLPTDLKKLDGVQCESCHGPVGLLSGGQHKPAVSFNAMVCGRCHDDGIGSHHDKYSLWIQSSSGHSLRSLALRGAADRSPPNLAVDSITNYASYGAGSCSRCHTAQGFAAYVQQQASDQCAGAEDGDVNGLYSCFLHDPSAASANPADQTNLATYLKGTLGLTADNVEPQTCQACHDPHTTGLRLEDDTHMLPAGFRVTNDESLRGQPGVVVADAGAGALCMLCHNSRNGARNDGIGIVSGTSFPNDKFTINGGDVARPTVGKPHDSTAADVFAGQNAFFTDSYPGKHLQFVNDACVGCHVAINTGNTITTSGPNHSFRVDENLCSNCHSNATNLTGESGIQAQFAAGMTDLSASIGNAAKKAVDLFIAANPAVNGDLNVKIAGKVVGTGTVPATVKLSQIASFTGPTAENGTSTVVVTLTNGMSIIVNSTFTSSLTGITWDTKDQNGADAAGQPIFSQSGLLARAIWNNVLLVNDGSKGVHNWTYVSNIMTKTKAALDAYTAAGTLPTGVTVP